MSRCTCETTGHCAVCRGVNSQESGSRRPVGCLDDQNRPGTRQCGVVALTGGCATHHRRFAPIQQVKRSEVGVVGRGLRVPIIGCRSRRGRWATARTVAYRATCDSAHTARPTRRLEAALLRSLACRRRNTFASELTRDSMDDLDREMAGVVVEVGLLRAEARELIRQTELIYAKVIDIALVVRHEPIEVTLPPVRADKEEEG